MLQMQLAIYKQPPASAHLGGLGTYLPCQGLSALLSQLPHSELLGSFVSPDNGAVVKSF